MHSTPIEDTTGGKGGDEDNSIWRKEKNCTQPQPIFLFFSVTFNLNFIILLIFNIVLIYILVLILDLVPIIIVYTVLLLCLYLNSINAVFPVFSNWVLVIVYLINTTIDNTMFPW